MNTIYKIILISAALITFYMSANSQEEYINKKKDVIIENLGPKVNSPGLDYAPTITPDGELMIFVSDRSGSKIQSGYAPSHDFWGINIYGKDFSDLQNPFNLDSNTSMELNTMMNEGVASITSDGKTLYFTACNRSNGLGNCDIFKSEWDGTKWSKPVALDAGVNSGYWESQPSISPDGSRLYFVSNRPTLENSGIDIWYSDYDDDFDEWTNPQNLKSINTPGKDCSPFIAPDNVTLLFSSDSYKPNLGGLDFYVTRYDYELKSWSYPAHLAEPLNSYEDEQFMSMPASGDLIYFASKRQDIEGFSGDLDLFVAHVPVMFRAVVLRINAVDENTGKHVPSEVFIRNTYTDKLITRHTSENDSIVKFVVSQPDFGLTSDSVRYVDYDIQSENKIGIAKKTIRIRNPKYAADDFRTYANILNVTLEYPNPDTKNQQTPWTSKHSILTANANITGVKNDIEYDLHKITFKEVEIKSTTPLLGFVFFGNNSAEIDRRYIMYNSNKSTANFDYSLLHNKGTLFCYYNVLNVIGKRLQQQSKAEITLTGTNSNFESEKNNTELSKNRALSVADYLINIWNIDPDRIKIETRNLPLKPSNTSAEDGREENRRVEITSNDPHILAPVVTIDTSFSLTPDIIKFKEPAKVKFGEAFWQLKVFDSANILKEFTGEGTVNYDLEWYISEEIKEPLNSKKINYEILVNDKEIQKTIVAKDSIDVEVIRLNEENYYSGEKFINEKYSLILFDFGSSSIKNDNNSIVDMINNRISSSSNISIIGYTDRTGNDEFNLKLSQKRAESAAVKINRGNIIVEGKGETKLLYDNSLPEGRFYSRTVDIITETPVNELQPYETLK